jgi:anti-anti-sigma regulatory factor
MLRIEKHFDGQTTVLRIIGRIRSQDLEEIRKEIVNNGPRIALDLAEVNVVDLDTVRFLAASEKEKVVLLHCSPYIREWILRERQEDERKQ